VHSRQEAPLLLCTVVITHLSPQSFLRWADFVVNPGTAPANLERGCR